MGVLGGRGIGLDAIVGECVIERLSCFARWINDAGPGLTSSTNGSRLQVSCP